MTPPAAARHDRELSSPTDRYAERLQPRTSSLAMRARLIERETANLAEAFARFGRDDALVEAAALVVAARRRFIAGYGKSFAYATLLAWDLAAGLSKVSLIDGTTVRPLDVLCDTGPSDVLVAFSFRRYHRQTVQLAEQFVLAGGVVIAITDDAGAPLTAQAERTLIVPTGSASYVDSPTAVAAISHLLSALTTASAKGARRRLAKRDRLSAVLHDYAE
jgi:DNA-binding MurR/RpiR family transcriptional regulator